METNLGREDMDIGEVRDNEYGMYPHEHEEHQHEACWGDEGIDAVGKEKDKGKGKGWGSKGKGKGMF